MRVIELRTWSSALSATCNGLSKMPAASRMQTCRLDVTNFLPYAGMAAAARSSACTLAPPLLCRLIFFVHVSGTKALVVALKAVGHHRFDSNGLRVAPRVPP